MCGRVIFFMGNAHKSRASPVSPPLVDAHHMFVVHVRIHQSVRQFLIMPRMAPVYQSCIDDHTSLTCQQFKRQDMLSETASATWVLWDPHGGGKNLTRHIKMGRVLQYSQALRLLSLLQEQQFLCAKAGHLMVERDMECVSSLLRSRDLH